MQYWKSDGSMGGGFHRPPRKEGTQMQNRKRLAWILAAALGAAILAFGLIFFGNTHIFLEGRVYPRNAASLDLRGKEISVSHYEALRARLPDCEITWEVPFHGSRYSQNTQAITVTRLSDEDIRVLDYLPMLKTVSAENCRDYPQLAALQEHRPDVQVRYNVTLGGASYPQDARTVTLPSVTDADIGLLPYLPELESIHAEACTDLNQLQKLWQARPDCHVYYFVPIAGNNCDADAAALELTGVSFREVSQQLIYFPRLEKVSLYNPAGTAEELRAMLDAYPDIAFFWQMDILGITASSDDEEIDLSGQSLDSPEPVKAAMAYFPNARQVTLCDCGMDNETLAAFREEMRGQYKVVWSVEVGYLTLRTDETCFMPGKYGFGLMDSWAYNLRYCEEMVCIDVGHKPITHCEWVRFMPNLKYLVLVDTLVTDLTPLTGLEHLVFLEIFLTDITDYSPLVTCTALEDLNLSYDYGDPEPIKQMTWLKRLWWAGCPISEEEFHQYLPDTEMMFLRISSTGTTWREGQNYYDMRDMLGVPYMIG